MLQRIISASVDRLRTNRLLSAAYHEVRLRRAAKGSASPILIYQMGKVGSTSVLESLRVRDLDRPLFHVHFLQPSNVARAAGILRRTFGYRGSVNRWGLYESQFVTRRYLRSARPDIKVISLVREPIARNVSSFFANVDMFVPHLASQFASGHVGVAELSDYYLRDFHEHNHPLTWFDDEMKATFGIDVYDTTDLKHRDRSTAFYQRDNIELLVVRLEDFNIALAPALKAFLGLNDFALVQKNQADDKDYSHAYHDFKKNFVLPNDYLNLMYSSKYARFFYSTSEIERFRAYWSTSR